MEYMNNTKKQSFVRPALLISFLLLSGLTFAQTANWHDTNWLQSGRIVTSKEIAENFEYLYQRVPDPNASPCSNGAILRYNATASKFECFSCSSGAGLIWGANGLECN